MDLKTKIKVYFTHYIKNNFNSDYSREKFFVFINSKDKDSIEFLCKNISKVKILKEDILSVSNNIFSKEISYFFDYIDNKEIDPFYISHFNSIYFKDDIEDLKI